MFWEETKFCYGHHMKGKCWSASPVIGFHHPPGEEQVTDLSLVLVIEAHSDKLDLTWKCIVSEPPSTMTPY